MDVMALVLLFPVMMLIGVLVSLEAVWMMISSLSVSFVIQILVRETGFEPVTRWPQTNCASRLRYSLRSSSGP